MPRGWIQRLIPPTCLMLCFACSDGGGETPDDNHDNLASLSGTLTVQPQQERFSLEEAEPNDTLEQASMIEVSPTTRLELFGSLSPAAGDNSDTFLFRPPTGGNLHVQAVLSFDFDPDHPTTHDLALGMYDLQSDDCRLDHSEQPMSLCVDGTGNPEVADFTVQGDFALTVQAVSGNAAYVLGLSFVEPSDPSARGRLKQPASVHTPQLPFRRNEWLVACDPGVSNAVCLAVLEASGVRVVQQAPCGICRVTAHGFDHREPLAAMRALQQTPGVRLVEPHYLYYPALVPDDEHFARQWHYQLINLPEAWDVTTGSSEVVVAVIDTGVLGTHPDLMERLSAGFDFIGDADAARDGDGPDEDPTDAGDLARGPGSSSFHGTHVTGTLGAHTNNGHDIAGVTWGCTIMPLRALGVGDGTSFDIAEAIRYAAGLENISGRVPERPADVINLSIASPAGSGASAVIQEAVNEAQARGVVIVAAAGNNGSDLPAYPAAFEGVISVAACDPQFALAPYSNFGPSVTLTAPGGNLALDLTGDGFGDGVLSLLGSETADGVRPTLSYQHGTSTACPHVSGVVALMKSANPQLTPPEVLEILRESAIDVEDARFGAGVLNAASAVVEAARRAGQLELNEPQLSVSTSILDFGNTVDRLFVQISNTGGGLLEITDVTGETLVGSDWLSVSAQGASDGTTVSSVVATVQRSGLPDGTYLGRITVASEQGIAGVDVRMSVGPAQTSTDILFVVAVDARTRETVAQDVTSAERGFAFHIDGLPPNTYKLYAGTDRDGDDLLCDPGELCGGLPSAIVTNEITVEAGQTAAELDFTVGELIFEARTPQGVIMDQGAPKRRHLIAR